MGEEAGNKSKPKQKCTGFIIMISSIRLLIGDKLQQTNYVQVIFIKFPMAVKLYLQTQSFCTQIGELYKWINLLFWSISLRLNTSKR